MELNRLLVWISGGAEGGGTFGHGRQPGLGHPHVERGQAIEGSQLDATVG